MIDLARQNNTTNLFECVNNRRKRTGGAVWGGKISANIVAIFL
jgi:hypothetical protein